MTECLHHGSELFCQVVRGEDGEITELLCSYDPESLGKRCVVGSWRENTTNQCRPPKKVAVVHWAHAELRSPRSARCASRLARRVEVHTGDGSNV